jgi:septal ring factor EnvC (AmiA/AmiB activator)
MCQKITALKSRSTTNGRTDAPKRLLWLLLACCLLLPAFQLAAQGKKELEEKRKKIIRDISTTERMIKKTAQSREAAYDKFLALQSQIESRENLIQTLEDEIVAAEDNIRRDEAIIAALSQDIERMRNEYGRTVRSAFRRKTLSNPLLYILSAESLNQAFRRWLFLRKYDRFRKQQAEAIAATQAMLAEKIRLANETRLEKAELLASMQGQKATLLGDLNDKNETLQSLTKDEERLKQDLQKKQLAHEALNQAIENVIQVEVRKRTEEARKPKPSAPATPPPSTQPIATKPEKPGTAPSNPAAAPERKPAAAPIQQESNEDAESFEFRKSRGRLPWPVENGFIARAFGKQKHPTIKTVEITNNGIDIRTDEDAAVRAVHEGTVAGVQFIPGHDYTVILQHGDYYTVYTNLAETNLSKGQQVRAKQAIGRVRNNPITGSAELHFELWHQKERINPASWIRK